MNDAERDLEKDTEDLFAPAEKVNELRDDEEFAEMEKQKSKTVREQEKKDRDEARQSFNNDMKEKALVRLKFLLEKTSLYSEFLSQKVTSIDSENNNNGQPDKKKRKKNKAEAVAAVAPEEQTETDEVRGIDNKVYRSEHNQS